MRKVFNFEQQIFNYQMLPIFNSLFNANCIYLIFDNTHVFFLYRNGTFNNKNKNKNNNKNTHK